MAILNGDMVYSFGPFLILTLGIGLSGATMLAPWMSLAVPTAIAQTPRDAKTGTFRDGWLKDLNLSTEQIEKIREIRRRYAGPLLQQQQAIAKAQQELDARMASNAPTEQIRQQFNQVRSLKQQQATTRLESMLAIREVLNPEQRQQLAQFMQQRGQRGRKNRQ
jgi:periplasmic protein CpxP/Spy